MENTYEKYIGMVESVDERSITYTHHAWNKHLKPAIIALRQSYLALGMAPYTQDVFDNLLSTSGIEEIAKAYESYLDADISKLKLSSLAIKNALLSAVPDMIGDIGKKRDELDKAMSDSKSYGNGEYSSYSYSIHLNWDSFSVVNAEPVLDEEKIRLASTTFIKTPLQAELYEKLLAMVNAKQDLVDFFKKKKVALPYSVFDDMFDKEEGGKIKVRSGAPFTMDRLMSFAQMQSML